MTMKEFQSLHEDEQLTILYKRGVYIGKSYGEYVSLLYQLEAFYVQIFYKSYRRQIHQMNYSDSASILDPYLEQIRVELESVL